MLHKSCVKSTKRCDGMRLSVGVHKQKCEEISAACQSHSLPSKSEQKEEQLCSCGGFFPGSVKGGGCVGLGGVGVAVLYVVGAEQSFTFPILHGSHVVWL